MYIKELESPEQGANRTLLEAYRHSRMHGVDGIDFDDTIWDEDVQPIADAMRRFGITDFTISCRTTDLIDTLAKFQALGVIVKGITKLQYTGAFGTEERDAVLLEVQPAFETE